MKNKGRFLAGMIIGLVLGGALIWFNSNTVSHQNKRLKVQLKNLHKQIALQDAVIDSMRLQHLDGLLHKVIEQIETELKESSQGVISDESVSKISTLCYAFQPYTLREGDSVSAVRLSPERGVLLLFLAGLKLNPISFQKITSQISFSGADLRDANLSHAWLNGIDLRDANLSNANLQGAQLKDAQLKGANFWGAHLEKAVLTRADLTRADMRWSNANEADFSRSNLTEADLSAAQLRKVNMHSAILRWVDFSGAFLNEATLDSTDMFRALLKKTHLERADLHDANLTLANLTDANLAETNLTATNLSEVIISGADWIAQVKKWKVIDASAIDSRYSVVTANTTGEPFFQLKRK